MATHLPPVSAAMLPAMHKPLGLLTTQQPSFAHLSLTDTLELTKSMFASTADAPFASSLRGTGPMQQANLHSEVHLAPPAFASSFVAYAASSASLCADVKDPLARSPASPSSSEESKAMNKSRYWTEEEHERFLQAISVFGAYDHKAIAKFVGSRSQGQVRSHSQKFFKKLETFDGQGLPSMARKTYKKRAKKSPEQGEAGVDHNSSSSSPVFKLR
jgi:SHAQKYF class myb-like DNA-binding protein